MKIAIVTQSYYPRPGGVTEHVHHTASSLRARGHDVKIVTTHFSERCTSTNDVVRIGRNVLVPVNGAWVNVTVGRNLYRRYRDALHDLAPDVVHTHCPLSPTLPVLALKAAPEKSRVIGTFHAAARRILSYSVFKPLINQHIGRMDTRIAVSDTARRLVAGYFPGDYTILPNGVDCTRFSPASEPVRQYRDDALNILYVGRMDHRKGLKYLFHAVARAAEHSDRKLRLMVVGDDGPRRYLLPRLPRSVDVVFTGVVAPDELPRYFATGDIFCSPAIGRESFGIVLLEAMASGVPVIGTAISGYLTLLRDGVNSLVVPPRDAHALADAITRLASDDTLRWKMRANALAFAQRFAWDNIIARLEAIYRDEPLVGGDFVDQHIVESALSAQKA